MAPFVHEIQVPLHLANHYGRGKKELFNSYCRAYFLGNFPDLMPIAMDGKKQDIHAQGGKIYAIYKPGMTPKELAARAGTKKKRG